MFRYSTGICHPAPDLVFSSVLEIWGTVQYLQTMGKLRDIVCVTKDGDIINPPYDNSQIPGIIEEIVRGEETKAAHPEPRRWMLSSE